MYLAHFHQKSRYAFLVPESPESKTFQLKTFHAKCPEKEPKNKKMLHLTGSPKLVSVAVQIFSISGYIPAGLAQLVEQLTLNQLVRGSSPRSSRTGHLSSAGRAVDL